MYQDSKRTYTAIVLLIRRLVWRRSRRRCVRGLLKLSITEQTHGNKKTIFFFIYNKETATTDKALVSKSFNLTRKPAFTHFGEHDKSHLT